MKIENTSKKGYWLVEYEDGYAGTAFYDCNLDHIIKLLSEQIPHRVVKSIEYIERKDR